MRQKNNVLFLGFNEVDIGTVGSWHHPEPEDSQEKEVAARERRGDDHRPLDTIYRR